MLKKLHANAYAWYHERIKQNNSLGNKMSTIKERVDEILDRPMNRRQFLKHVGLLILTAVGITGIINAFDSKNASKNASGVQDPDGMAYGSSMYAGGKKPV